MLRDDIRAIRRSAVLPVLIGEEDPVPDSLTDHIPWLVANRRFADYRAIVARAPSRLDRFPVAAVCGECARSRSTATSVRAVPLLPKDR
jgi:arginine/ornithine N-succinyltransferase beta subunit